MALIRVGDDVAGLLRAALGVSAVTPCRTVDDAPVPCQTRERAGQHPMLGVLQPECLPEIAVVHINMAEIAVRQPRGSAGAREAKHGLAGRQAQVCAQIAWVIKRIGGRRQPIATHGWLTSTRCLRNGRELRAVNRAMDVHDAQLDEITFGELTRAHDEVKRRAATQPTLTPHNVEERAAEYAATADHT